VERPDPGHRGRHVPVGVRGAVRRAGRRDPDPIPDALAAAPGRHPAAGDRPHRR
jgi:hypothetical protein